MRRVLLLHQEGVTRPFRARFDAAFVEALRSVELGLIDLYEESVETERFPGPEQAQLIRDYLKEKYAGLAIDVIVVVGDRALTFARENREMFGNPPIVGVDSPIGQFNGTKNDTGLQGGQWIAGTIDLALALRPDTSTVVVVDGVRENRREVETEIRGQLKGRTPQVDLVYLPDLPLPDLVARVAAAPEHSVVVFVRQTMRGGTEDADPLEAVSRVVRSSPVPAFGQIEEFVGSGMTGSYVWEFETDAKRLAVMANGIATGASPGDMPIGRSTYAPVVDWRQLQRWQIPDARLPAGSRVLFRTESYFELYRSYFVAGLLVFGAQLALIIGLLMQRVQRRRAEQESRRNVERYRSVVDTQSDLICRFRPDSTLTFVNDAYCRFWGKTRDELIGRHFVDLIPASARQGVLERIARTPRGSDSLEYPVIMADGSIGWHHWVNHAIVDASGRLVELQGVGRDVTDRKRAEEAVGQLEAHNSAILRAIPDLMFVLLRDGTYVDYHARDRSLLFAPPEQFIGRKVRDILPSATAELLMAALEQACQTEEPVVVEYELPLDGLRYFEARLVYAEHDRVLSIVRDVTESKRTLALSRDLAGRLIVSQEAERRRIARDLHDDTCQEVAGVAIEISNLLRNRDIDGTAVQQGLTDIYSRVTGVAESLRLLSHDLHPSVLQHIGLIPALQAHCAEVERQHDMQVRLIADIGIEPPSQAVALSLFRITQEALRNAAKHGNARHVTVGLSRADDRLTLSIADDGDGFDVAGARHEGGLGLVSIEERARLVKGHVTIHSRPRHGTTIHVGVPVAGEAGSGIHAVSRLA